MLEQLFPSLKMGESVPFFLQIKDRYLCKEPNLKYSRNID